MDISLIIIAHPVIYSTFLVFSDINLLQLIVVGSQKKKKSQKGIVVSVVMKGQGVSSIVWWMVLVGDPLSFVTHRKNNQ